MNQMSTNQSISGLSEQKVPLKTRWLAIGTGGLFGIVGCLHYGAFFLFVPSILLLGAIVEPWLPRLGKVLLAVGAAVLTFYSLFLGLPAVLLIRGLGHHSLEDSVFLVLSLLSVVLVILCDVMLVKNERKLRHET
jgi:hypothetical protein